MSDVSEARVMLHDDSDGDIRMTRRNSYCTTNERKRREFALQEIDRFEDDLCVS